MLPLLHDGGELSGSERGCGAVALLRPLPLPQRGHVRRGDGRKRPEAAAAPGGGGGGRASAAAAGGGPQESEAAGTIEIQSYM